MHNLAISALVAALAFPTIASAAWHVDLVNDELVIIGSAETASGLPSFVSIRCDGDQIKITGETDQSAYSDEILADYGKAMALVEFGSIEGRTHLPLPAVLSRSVGNVVMVTVSPDAETSRAIAKSIMQGNRLGFAAVHPAMDPEFNTRRVLSGGFSAVAIALASACPELTSR